MPSPFPGMDPYLELPHIWQDFHANLAGEIQAQLAPRLRPRYYAALVPRIVYDTTVEYGPHRQDRIPDAGVYLLGEAPAVYTIAPPPTPPPNITPPLIAPILVEFEVYEQRLEVRWTETGELVTAIEILSPVNKRLGHEAHEAYLQKRRELLATPAHLLEIDFVRVGRRPTTPLMPLPDAPYFVFLSRAQARDQVEFWPVPLRDPIPTVAVPLRDPDPDVALDLGQALKSIYDRAAYDLRIDYRPPPPPPDFSPDDAAWIDAQLQASRAPK